MGKLLSALLHLQSIERQVADIKSRLRIRQNAVSGQQRKIDELRSEFDSLKEQSLQKRKKSDQLDLDLKTRDAKVSNLRTVLNTAKTNKEYAAILTEINTLKADNAKYEEEALKIMQDIDTLKVQCDETQAVIDVEQTRLEETTRTNADEIERLDGIQNELSTKRDAAAKLVPADELVRFERIGASSRGDAMAPVEVHGAKPPFSYVCGGCYMGLNAEHANALYTRDEIRTCDSCGRILYLTESAQAEK